MDSASPERSLHVERVDDLPVLFACLDRLGVAEPLDRQFHNHEHHFWKGELTFGEVVSVWLAFLLSQGDHRLYRLEGWAEQHQLSLQALLGKPVGALKGLYPGQAGRQTDRPSAELLLRAFQGINLIVGVVAGQVLRLLTPLNALQKKLLALWDLPSDLYARLELHFADPPPH
jgi:hypothetical protein